MVDALASEYGWHPDYVLDLPCDVSAQLVHAILYRKGVKTHRRAVREEAHEPLEDRLKSIFEIN